MSGGVIAVVPVRGLDTGKSRLAGDLSPKARTALTRRMLHGVVRAAVDSGGVDAVAVISPDPAALAAARSVDETVVPLAQDPTTPGLNAAITAGRDWAWRQGADAVLVLFGDLPLLAPADVQRLVEHEAPLVLAPDRHGAGTNALLLRLTGVGTDAAIRFRFQYGTGSYARHVAEARRLGLVVVTSAAFGTAFDLDTPEDWRTLLTLETRKSSTEEAIALPTLPGGIDDAHPAEGGGA